MKTKKEIYLKYLYLLGVFIIQSFQAGGQDTNFQQLQTQITRLEQKIKYLDTTIRCFERDSLAAPTRNDIENHRLQGLVITDIKRISLQIGGFVQADFIHDFMEMTNRDAFQTSSIVVQTDHHNNTEFSIRQSRLNFSAKGPTQFGDFFALLEFDLWGPNGTSNPRIRHAWINIGKWGFGQYWSNFTDNDTWPNLIDFWGPNAAIWKRQVQIRFTQPLNKHNVLAFSLEQPGSDVTFPVDSTSWTVRTLYPDFIGSYTLNWNDNNSHIKLSGLLHPISYETNTEKTQNIIAGAFNIAGNIRTFGNDALKFQASYGTGYARYNEDLSGMGYEAMPNPMNGYELESVMQYYFWIFYDHWWGKKFSSTIGWGHVGINREDYFAPATISYTNYGAVNFLWYPNKYFKTGIEFLYGNRKNHNGETGENFRIQYSAFVRL